MNVYFITDKTYRVFSSLKKYLFILIALFFFNESYCQHTRGGNYYETIQVNNEERTYLLHLPFGYSFLKGTALPLVVFLHGNGGTGRASAFESKFNRISDREKLMIVYPDGYERSWNDARNKTKSSIEGIDDILFLTKLISQLKETYPVDTDRIYIGGVSNGGFMAQTMVCRSEIRFAAFFSVIATLPEKLNDPMIDYPCNALYILGTEDPFVPYEGGVVAGKTGGRVLSAEESIGFWLEKNTCLDSREMTPFIDNKDDGVQVQKIIYSDCHDALEVVLIKMTNAGHQYPQGIRIPMAGNMCKDINASEEIMKFLKGKSISEEN